MVQRPGPAGKFAQAGNMVRNTTVLRTIYEETKNPKKKKEGKKAGWGGKGEGKKGRPCETRRDVPC